MVDGPGIVSAQAEKPAHFKIHAKDHEGHPRKDGGDNFKVHINGSEGPATVKDNGMHEFSKHVVLMITKGMAPMMLPTRLKSPVTTRLRCCSMMANQSLTLHTMCT